MRLFIAITLDNEVKDILCGVMNELKRHGAHGVFSLRENLHLTLVFIGETSRSADIESIMDNAAGKEFVVSIGGLGTFPGGILWAGVKAEARLFDLQGYLTESLRRSGFNIEERIYNPHLTLGRKMTLPEDYKRIILPDIKMTVQGFSLIKSELRTGGAVYTEIHRNALI